jgi:hypothetical protein
VKDGWLDGGDFIKSERYRWQLETDASPFLREHIALVCKFINIYIYIFNQLIYLDLYKNINISDNYPCFFFP